MRWVFKPMVLVGEKLVKASTQSITVVVGITYHGMTIDAMFKQAFCRDRQQIESIKDDDCSKHFISTCFHDKYRHFLLLFELNHVIRSLAISCH